MSDKYILNGHEPVACNDLMAWANWFENRKPNGEWVVGNDTIGNSRISTVFLGIDHNWGYGPPLLFETMVFGGSLSDDMDRYSTWDEAVSGHAAMVERVRAQL